MSYTAAIITVSDKCSIGERVDTSGPALCRLLADNGWTVSYCATVADEEDQIIRELLKSAEEYRADLILTTGGTGFSPRDITPEATLNVIQRRTPGLSEAMRAESMRITPKGCLSRGESGIYKGSLIINLPGSEKAAKENILVVLPALKHGIDMIHSGGSADCGGQD